MDETGKILNIRSGYIKTFRIMFQMFPRNEDRKTIVIYLYMRFPKKAGTGSAFPCDD
jgi:hypothetical protein